MLYIIYMALQGRMDIAGMPLIMSFSKIHGDGQPGLCFQQKEEDKEVSLKHSPNLENLSPQRKCSHLPVYPCHQNRHQPGNSQGKHQLGCSGSLSCWPSNLACKRFGLPVNPVFLQVSAALRSKSCITLHMCSILLFRYVMQLYTKSQSSVKSGTIMSACKVAGWNARISKAFSSCLK